MNNFILKIIIDVVLVCLLLACSYEDFKNKIIPNKYTIPAIVAGFVLMSINGGFNGLKDSVLGFLLGFFIFLLPFMFGAMGAGDVKLLAAIGALKGFTFTLYSFVAAGIAGGVMVVVYIIYKRQFIKTMINMFGIIIKPFAKVIYLNTGNKIAKKIFDFFEGVKQKSLELYIPYAIPIAIGAILVLIGSYNNLL